MAVPVHIVAGFLGTGKTTAIRHQLSSRTHEKVAVIVNDFGDAGLDEAVLAGEQSFAIRNIPGGCVCCTAPEGFVDALGAVLAEQPDRLIIEPTGLARPQDIVDTIRRSPHKDALALGPLVVLVDPARLGAKSHDEAELIALQAGIADVLVANRTDLASPDALAKFDALADSLWPRPLSVHKTTRGKLPTEAFEWPANEGARLPRAGKHAHDHDHAHSHASTSAHTVRSFRWSPDTVFSRERISRAALRASEGLAGAKLARWKGIFRTDEGVVLLEVAGGQMHEERSPFRRDSRLDVILEGGGEDAFARIGSWLAGAVLSDSDLAARATRVELVFPNGRTRFVTRDELLGLPGGVDDVAALVPKRSGAAARVSALLAAHKAPEEGSAVVCAADGFASEPVPLAALREGLLVHSVNGEPLDAKQGGPYRLLIPEGVPGAPSACANVKGVVRIVLK
ncbi:MAG: molybdopterin-dependent oxidoreductase [Deltaproteobacteria bacterium]|nr:molybdopterin-dependent oxidoreductase [Deltaproteobacteria bacterium]